MAKQIKQFRYYADDATAGDNQPSTISANQLFTGSIFGDCFPIYQLGIQTIPGIKFYLNNSLYPVIVNASGVYEMDLNSNASISNLTFDLNSLKEINKNQNTYLIIDICYETGVE